MLVFSAGGVDQSISTISVNGNIADPTIGVKRDYPLSLASEKKAVGAYRDERIVSTSSTKPSALSPSVT